MRAPSRLMSIRKPASTICGLLGAACLAMSPAGAQHTIERSRIDTTFAFSNTGSVQLELAGGSIRVTAWARNDARIVAYVENGIVRAEVGSDRIRIETRDDRSRRRGEAYYEINVPVGVTVNASTAGGSINVAGTRAGVVLEAVGGSVMASDLQGRIELETTGGSVNLQRADGRIRVRTVGGSVAISEVKGDVDVNSVGGPVRIDRADLSGFAFEAMGGALDYSGTFAPDGKYDIRSHSGTVTLRLPQKLAASLEVETWSGQFHSQDFQLTLQPGLAVGRTNQRRVFTINGGGTRISISTHSGDVYLRRVNVGSRREH
jgi:hypothetical protein